MDYCRQKELSQEVEDKAFYLSKPSVSSLAHQIGEDVFDLAKTLQVACISKAVLSQPFTSSLNLELSYPLPYHMSNTDYKL